MKIKKPGQEDVFSSQPGFDYSLAILTGGHKLFGCATSCCSHTFYFTGPGIPLQHFSDSGSSYRPYVPSAGLKDPIVIRLDRFQNLRRKPFALKVQPLDLGIDLALLILIPLGNLLLIPLFFPDTGDPGRVEREESQKGIHDVSLKRLVAIEHSPIVAGGDSFGGFPDRFRQGAEGGRQYPARIAACVAFKSIRYSSQKSCCFGVNPAISSITLVEP